MYQDKFVNRHNGPSPDETKVMLKALNVNSMDELIDQTVPSAIRLNRTLNIAPALSEFEYHRHLKILVWAILVPLFLR
jgi:glycine dehydrogenase